MNIITTSGWVLVALFIGGCGDSDGGGTGGGGSGGGGGATGGSGASGGQANGGTGGVAMCDDAALLTAATDYCDAAAILWADVDCPFEPCAEQNFDGLISTALAAGCSCELVAMYECEGARFPDETAAACTCDGTQVLCPDEDLCAAEKAAVDTCFGG